MDDEALPKSSQKEKENNINKSNQKDKKNKENKIAKFNQDKILFMENKSNLNIQHRKHLKSLIITNNKPKFKSQIYMKDKIFVLNFPNSQKNTKDRIKILKNSSKKINQDNNKNKDKLLINENFENLPSYSKLLRKALYSNSDIDSFDNRRSKNIKDNDSNRRSLSEEKKEDSDSSQNNESEEISDKHMHEDNKTLMDVIRNKSLKNSQNEQEKINNLMNNKSQNNEIIEEKNNYNYPDVLLTISTTISEVEIIQSSLNNANKINNIISTSDSNKDSNINLSENTNNEKCDKNSIENNTTDILIPNSENNKSNIQPSSPSKKINSFNGLNFHIIMVPSSLEKDIRKFYKFKETLGGGNFGTVRKAFRRNDDKNNREYFAIKSISTKNLSEKEFTNLIKEVSIISGLCHPNIIKFYETYHDKIFFHLVMELCEGKDSHNQIVKEEKCDERKVVNLIMKVLLAIAHCHSRGVTHRDLKPENILYENNSPDAEIKIIDFGLSRKYSKTDKLHSVLGTPLYVAPEVLKGNYDQKCDIWSIGAMTFLLLSGKPPFNGSTDQEIFKNILNSEVKFDSPVWKNVSNEAKSFVKLCLEKNSSKRPSAIKALDHPWFAKVLKASHNLQNLGVDILLNIKNFNIKQKFKQMIIQHLLTSMKKEELKVYKRAFFAIDYYHNGCIEEEELKKAFQSKKIEITDEEIKHLFQILDQNLKGAIDYTEFLMAGVNKAKLFTTEKLTKAFNYFDINKSGCIENSDLNECLLRNGKKCVNENDINFFIYEALKDIDDKKGYDKDSEIFTKVSKEDFFKIFKDN